MTLNKCSKTWSLKKSFWLIGKTMEKTKKLELLPAPVKIKTGEEPKDILNVVKRSITLTKEEYQRPQEWVKQIAEMIEATFAAKIECIAATPPIVRKLTDKLDGDVQVSFIAIDVSEVMKKEDGFN